MWIMSVKTVVVSIFVDLEVDKGSLLLLFIHLEERQAPYLLIKFLFPPKLQEDSF